MSLPEGGVLLGIGVRGDQVPASADPEILRAKAGDAAAFQHIMQRHESLVLRTALRVLGNREDALDAAQDVFIRLYRYLDRLDARRPMEPWLYQMTLNACRDLAKKRSRWNSAGKHSSSTTAISSNPAARNLDAAIETQVVEEGLKLLTERERAAVVLRDIEGLSTEDVAAVMRIGQFTVRSLISRARVKLRRHRNERLGPDHAL